MTSFEFQVSIPPAIFSDTLEAIDRAPKTMNTFIEKALKPDIEQAVNMRLRTEPGKPRYPLRWKSEKQRRYVMAKLRRQNNLPYRRTHRLVNSWQVTVLSDNQGGLIEVKHPWKGIEYVVGGGSRRQPMFPHWYNADTILLEEEQRAEDALTDVWLLILDAKPGSFA